MLLSSARRLALFKNGRYVGKAALEKHTGSYPRIHPIADLVEVMKDKGLSVTSPLTVPQAAASDLVKRCGGDVRYGAQLKCQDFQQACDELEPVLDEVLSVLE